MRVTGGLFRSRPLKAPRGDATRPTADRVRESLFSILQSAGRLRGARVLDLFAGTGAFSFEAISRGANEATLVEMNRPALAVIRENADSLGVLSSIHIVPRSVEQALRSPLAGAPFDLVFLDPPYADVAGPTIADALARLVSAPYIAARATVILEHAKQDAPPLVEGLVCDETRRYGDTMLTFYSAKDVAAVGEQPT